MNLEQWKKISKGTMVILLIGTLIIALTIGFIKLILHSPVIILSILEVSLVTFLAAPFIISYFKEKEW